VSQRQLRIGIAGLGRAFSIMLPALASEKVRIVAGADPRPEARARFRTEFQAAAYATVEEMCADPAVEAVYVSTPHGFHRANVEAAAARGKHVLVEKPMALTLADCRAMTAAARAAGVVLIVGHSHSFDLPVAKAREIIASGAVGELKMITSAYYTDFLYRPRRREELDTSQGGGVIYNQAPHQVDVVRLLGGGRVQSVRANVGIWDAARPTEGAYQALLTFESGATASLTYSGYAHFDGDELVDWITEGGLPKDPARYGATRKALAAAASIEEEERLKARVNYGGEGYGGPQNAAGSGQQRFHQHFGLVVASCEGADLRPTAKGVHVYGDTERRFEALAPPRVYRDEVIDEFYRAVVEDAPVIHSGDWATATMEVCIAMLRSHRDGREIELVHQVSIGEHAP
jgi:phthalate 4,5-cis-dihydrodiol dehydrogenase